jgi:hypothetical protein
MPNSQLPTSTSSSSSVATSPATTTDVSAPSQETSATPTGGKVKSHAAAIGAGVGVPVGLIALGLIGALVWRHRRKNAHKPDGLVGEMDGGYTDNNVAAQELDSHAPVDGAASNQKAYYGGRDYKNAPTPLSELGSPRQEAHEMDATTLR